MWKEQSLAVSENKHTDLLALHNNRRGSSEQLQKLSWIYFLPQSTCLGKLKSHKSSSQKTVPSYYLKIGSSENNIPTNNKNTRKMCPQKQFKIITYYFKMNQKALRKQFKTWKNNKSQK